MNLPTPVLFGKVVGTVGIPVIGGLVGTGAMKDERKIYCGVLSVYIFRGMHAYIQTESGNQAWAYSDLITWACNQAI